MAHGIVSLQSATNAAIRTSSETPALIQVRQVSAKGFAVYFAESPKFKPEGVLVACYRNGKSVGA